MNFAAHNTTKELFPSVRSEDNRPSTASLISQSLAPDSNFLNMSQRMTSSRDHDLTYFSSSLFGPCDYFLPGCNYLSKRPLTMHLSSTRNSYDVIIPIVSRSLGLIISIDSIENSAVILGHRFLEEDKVGQFVDFKLIRNVGDIIIAINGRDVTKLSLVEVMRILCSCGEYASLRLAENAALTSDSHEIAKQQSKVIDSIRCRERSTPGLYIKRLRKLISFSRREESSGDSAKLAINSFFLHQFSMEEIAPFLPQDISINLFSKMTNDEIFVLINIMRNRFTSVRNLSITSHDLGGNVAVEIANMLKQNTSVKKLDLGLNSIRDDGIVLISQALETNSTLELLDLRSNSFGKEGTKGLAKMLTLNKALKELDLSFNGIDNECASILADALRKNSTLKVLNLKLISAEELGMSSFINCLRGQTPNEIVNSNHTLKSIQFFSVATSHSYKVVLKKIDELIMINVKNGPEQARRAKICDFLKKNVYNSAIANRPLDYKLIPNLLEMIMMEGNTSKLPCIYEILVNLPELFTGCENHCDKFKSDKKRSLLCAEGARQSKKIRVE